MKLFIVLCSVGSPTVAETATMDSHFLGLVFIQQFSLSCFIIRNFFQEGKTTAVSSLQAWAWKSQNVSYMVFYCQNKSQYSSYSNGEEIESTGDVRSGLCSKGWLGRIVGNHIGRLSTTVPKSTHLDDLECTYL